MSPSGRLPDGFRIRLRDRLLRADGGRVLVGGSPIRAVRLSARASELLADGELRVSDAATAGLARRLLDDNIADPILDDIEAVGLDDLTVVVPVRDRPEQLERCLQALQPLRVIVVDDASRDPRRVGDVAARHGARVVHLGTNLGPAGARNAGLRQVTTPLVAFVDSDVTVGADALCALARHCADPRLALVGPRVAGRVRSGRSRWFQRYETTASSLDLGRDPASVRPAAAVGWLPSACLVGRTAHLRGDIGGFAGTWRVAEDVDLVWRLVDAGFAVRYDPDVVAHHDVRGDVRQWLGRKFVYGTGGAALARRHGGKVAPAVLSPTMAIAGAALLQRRWWSLPVAAGTAGVGAAMLARRLPTENGRGALAARLALRGTWWAVRQETGLLLRHWWPVTAAAAPVSRSVRRACVTAVVVDLAVFLYERPGVDPLTALAARRLDDMAYGSGLWWGALEAGSPGCLTVRRSAATLDR